jgi:hypothetical protein
MASKVAEINDINSMFGAGEGFNVEMCFLRYGLLVTNQSWSDSDRMHSYTYYNPSYNYQCRIDLANRVNTALRSAKP